MDGTPTVAAAQQINDMTAYARMEALLHGQTEVLEMISKGNSLADILKSIVQWAELQSNGELVASILLLDREGKHFLRGAAPSLPDDYNNALHGLTVGPHTGPCGTAATIHEMVVIENLETDNRWPNFKELATQLDNVKACWSTPLMSKDGRVLGTFAVYYRQPRKPSFDDMQIIRLVSRTAVIAIEHKLAEDERIASAQRFWSMIQQAPVATSVYTGRDMIISLANEAMLKVWGKDASVIGKPLHEALPELEGQPFMQLLQDVFTTGNSYNAKEDRADLVVNGRLQTFYFNFTYQALRDAHGDIYAILNMAVDVTESVMARRKIQEQEERYRTLAAELDTRVQERTRELQRANENLERSNTELAQYAYVASHDLQEPLRKIRVFSSMLKERANLNEASEDLLARVLSSSGRMTQLINDLLEFSRLLNAGKAIQPTDLNDAMRNVLLDFELSIQEKNAIITMDRLPVLEAVPLQMNQLFNNLVSNAIKFSKADTALQLTITCRELPEEEVKQLPVTRSMKYYEINFADNGIGFEQQYAEQVFEVFKRLHSREAYPGSGIGLALCRKIVENHHGYLYATSKQGVGTVIHVILPEKQ